MERGCVCAVVSSRRVRDRRDGQLFFSCSKRSVVKTESDGRTSVGILALARLQPRAGRSNQGRSVRRCRCRLRRQACAISCSFSRPAWPCRVGDGIIMRSAGLETRRSRHCHRLVPTSPNDQGDGNFMILSYRQCHPSHRPDSVLPFYMHLIWPCEIDAHHVHQIAKAMT